MTKKLGNFKPFYHPKYGWQWLEMEQTSEQQVLADLKFNEDNKKKIKKHKNL